MSTYKYLRYDNKTGTGVLVLPSLRTLHDYKNYIRPTRGFHPDMLKKMLMNLLRKLHHFLKLKDMLPYYLMK